MSTAILIDAPRVKRRGPNRETRRAIEDGASRDLARYLFSLGPLPLDAVPLREARARYAIFRGARGAKAVHAALLTHPSHNVKFKKTDAVVYGLALAPASLSGEWNTCRYRTPKCEGGCVAFAGKGELASVIAGRVRKTEFLAADPYAFMAILSDEIRRLTRRLPNVRVRLNTFSDLPWELIAPDLFTAYPNVSFYDYTKWPNRHALPANYRLTYSASERTEDAEIVDRVSTGRNVAVIFRVKPKAALPSTYLGLRVIDADKSDDRYSDPRGVIVGLRAKGRMRRPGFDGMVREVA